ncbi:MAG: J domain-containing protein [Pyrinomonadaceae bacterium]
MVNYYEILKVSPKATRAEIKSAYRGLARKLHPDKNHGSEETARAFASIAEAWEILGNPKERAEYDSRLLEVSYNGHLNGNSVFASSNSHARRWRQLVYEHRYNEIIDRMIEEERRESMDLQKIIFPTVALFVSTLAVAVFKPQIFANSAIIGKIVVISLFVAGLIHLWGRICEGLERFTYNLGDIHDSILENADSPSKPYSRIFAGSFLLVGVVASFLVGLLIGNFMDLASANASAIFSRNLQPELIFYPPIFVMIVDAVHSFASQVEG